MKLPLSEFEAYCSWSDSYTRNCIIDTDSFELILLCWGAGQATPIHDHGGEECWVYFVDGEFKETIYKENAEGQFAASKVSEVKGGDVTYMVDFMGFHRLENISNKRSMSLHLYAKPIRNCQIYDEEASTFSNHELNYDTVQ